MIGSYYDLKDEIDFTSWLEYFTDGIIDELLRVKKELGREMISPGSVLRDYHQKMIDLGIIVKMGKGRRLTIN